ncbi:MAG TPA: type II toxin-antitoxin system HipA family toxin [Steroidobacteraceae bacterium]|nr:type II toxin-antitoxin system HipA family toxin [Steroidobacteraceae bacterium]
MSTRQDALEVWLDCELGPPARVGTLAHERGRIRFRYEREWLEDARAFALDPDLSLQGRPLRPRPGRGNFGVFLGSAPGRWGQALMRRREALQARDEKRSPRTLRAWDFLIGVQDMTRQGALRFRRPGTAQFLGDEPMAPPPATTLRELEAIAHELGRRRIADRDALRTWLAVLAVPGASLGGTWPKANFTQADGSLWVGKFPARDDERDVGAWEYVLHRLAAQAGVDVPPARLIRLNGEFHTFCVQRFDRAGGARRCYASAMTLLRKRRSAGSSYLDLARFIRTRGDAEHAAADLARLFRRVAFNVAVGNRDDHLRNHGFVLGERGWRLAPAFDMNPNIDRTEHALNIDERDPRPSLETVRGTAAFYGLPDERAGQILEEVAAAVDGWRDVAREQHIARADVVLTARAFSAHAQFRARGSRSSLS